MKKEVTFTIIMEYTTTVHQDTDMGFSIEESIEADRYDLEEYREDLACALDDSKCVSVTVKEIKEIKEREEVINYDI